jgi:formylglycine-generating enzyme
VTVAERPLDPALFPDLPPEDLEPGASVFSPTAGPVDLSDWRQWWRWSVGADWQHPFGLGQASPRRPITRWCRFPYHDAEAYASWAGRRLPSEAEWEYGAGGQHYDVRLG